MKCTCCKLHHTRDPKIFKKVFRVGRKIRLAAAGDRERYFTITAIGKERFLGIDSQTGAEWTLLISQGDWEKV